MRFFRDEAFLEEGTARREAERGTFDPTYLVYSVGKLMLLKLRRDYKEQQGGEVLAARVPRPAARQRHGAPSRRTGSSCWATQAGDLLEWNHGMPLYEYECDACGHAVRADSEVLRSPVGRVPSCGKRHVHKLPSSPGDSVQGHRAGTSPTTRKKGTK